MAKRAAFLVMVLASFTIGLAQSRAYRSINFGDSPYTVAMKMLNDSAFQSVPFTTQVSPDNSAALRADLAFGSLVDIGGLSYGIHFKFYDNKLFRIQFRSNPLNANYFDTEVRRFRDNLLAVIQKAHSSPDWRQSVSFFDMQTGRISWSDIWNAKTDGVGYKIGIGEGEDTYYAAMWVEYAPLLNKYNQANQVKNNAAQQKSANDF